jgi:hypothetical protein
MMMMLVNQKQWCLESWDMKNFPPCHNMTLRPPNSADLGTNAQTINWMIICHQYMGAFGKRSLVGEVRGLSIQQVMGSTTINAGITQSDYLIQ